MKKRKLYRKQCDGCKFYNSECEQGACSIYPYQKEKKTEVKEKKIHDAG